MVVSGEEVSEGVGSCVLNSGLGPLALEGEGEVATRPAWGGEVGWGVAHGLVESCAAWF